MSDLGFDAPASVPEVPFPDPETECFVIAPIGEHGSDTRRRANNVLRHVIEPAINGLGLLAVRADQLAEPGSINRQILKHVLTARATVADLTDANPNVYYELAVRHSAGLPVVLIARLDTRLPFDLQTQRTVFFDDRDLSSAAQATEGIRRHLVHALQSQDQGSPVLEVADLEILSRAGAEQRRVAELVELVETLDKSSRRQFGELQQSLRRMPANPERMHNVRAVLRAIRSLEERARALAPTGASKEQVEELVLVCAKARETAELALEHAGAGTAQQ